MSSTPPRRNWLRRTARDGLARDLAAERRCRRRRAAPPRPSEDDVERLPRLLQPGEAAARRHPWHHPLSSRTRRGRSGRRRRSWTSCDGRSARPRTTYWQVRSTVATLEKLKDKLLREADELGRRPATAARRHLRLEVCHRGSNAVVDTVDGGGSPMPPSRDRGLREQHGGCDGPGRGQLAPHETHHDGGPRVARADAYRKSRTAEPRL